MLQNRTGLPVTVAMVTFWRHLVAPGGLRRKKQGVWAWAPTV
jgi:hypothetical protein